MKGLAFSAVTYGDWLSRGSAADIDILVSPYDLHAAEGILLDLGFDARLGSVLPGRGSSLGAYNRWLHYERGYWSSRLGAVDLHWRTMPGSRRWASFDASWESRRIAKLPTGEVATLGPVESILIAAAQGESEGWRRLKRMADLWMAWRGATPVQRREALHVSPLVGRAIRGLPQVWVRAGKGIESQCLEQSSGGGCGECAVGAGPLWTQLRSRCLVRCCLHGGARG